MSEYMIRISVRNLVEFILREGDIDNRTTGSMEKDAMLKGGKIHRKIQRRMGAGYRAEVSLKYRYDCGDFIIQLEGRADGILEEDGRTTVDEIKGVVRNLEHIKEPVGIHLAQAKCYAYIYAEQESLEEISVQMTYCNLETEEIKRFRQKYTKEELRIWFEELLRAYEKWARFQKEWREVRNASIQKSTFPFPYRKGQKKLAAAVYRTIEQEKKLFIQAPTGVGKTMCTVFPAVHAVGAGHGEKIFYLTAKTITRTVAEQAFSILREQGLHYKVITLTAKEKICFMEEAECNPDYCPYAKGHFDRVNDAVFDLISGSDELTRSRIEGQARKYRVCPFEMALDISVWSDAVICDYNYVFDPSARLKRFFSDNAKGDYIFLVDEAHNLVDRGREMYSASICKEEILHIRQLVKNEDTKLARLLSASNQQLLELKKECENYRVLDSISHVALKLINVFGELERYLEDRKENDDKRAQVLDFYFKVRSFLNIYDILDENYVIYSEFEKNGEFYVKLFCVNPAENLKACMDQGVSTVFFSATLLPIYYYRKLLGAEEEDYAIYAETTFDQRNRLLMLGTDVSTKYTKRGREMYERFAEYILETVMTRRGNYLVFCPSYQLMQDVYETCLEKFEKFPEVNSIMQSQYMSEEERESFLGTFEKSGSGILVGFCVMGGIFSEGIDLADDRLIGAVILGTGLPQICNEREILKQYFDSRNMSGFDYAYMYPGMNKVLQSAGRVIRTENDRGIVLLLDERFQEYRYQEVFPREWQGYKLCGLHNVQTYLNDFWRGKDENYERSVNEE